ncbi:PucR family transcriptional regulator [Streptomyces sp. NPDC004838]
MTTTWARPGLGAVIDDLGSTLLRVIAGPAASHQPVGSLSIYDPADGVEVAAGGLLLGVGVTDRRTVSALLGELRGYSAAALLLKAPVPLDEKTRHEADAAGVSVIEVSRGVPWEQLIVLLRTLLNPPEPGDGLDELAGHPVGDLFQLANAVSGLLDAPITIEDRSSRVLAFSGGQENTDEGRVRTLLGRRVPDNYQRVLTERGVFRELYRSREPVYFPPFVESDMPRTAIAVRAGEEVLGFMWAVVREPLPEHRSRAFAEATRLVALRLLKERVGTTADTRARAALAAGLLDGSAPPEEAARRLGLLGEPVAVIALAADTPDGREAADGQDDVQRAADLRRVTDAFALHLGGVHRSAAATGLGDVVYGLLPVPGTDDGETAALRIAARFLERMGPRLDLRAGVGRVARGPAEIARSRADADDVLKVLRGGLRAERAATTQSVRADLLVLRLGEVSGWDDRPESGAVARLLAYDAEHRSDLTGTLAAYLDAFADVARAAAAVHVHPNTFRYRLTRLSEIGALDLTDPDARFEALIDLRLHRLRRARRASGAPWPTYG